MKENIIVIGLRNWHALAHLASEHIADELSSLGHTVVYIPPPIGFLESIIILFKKRDAGFIINFFKSLFSRKKMLKIKENLFIASGLPVLLNFGFSSIIDSFNELLFWNYINQISKDLKFADYVLYTTFCIPTCVKDKKCKLLVYDCVDNISALPNNKIQSAGFRRLENKLIKNTHLWFAISQPLFDERKKINKNGFLELPSIDPGNFRNYPKHENIKQMFNLLGRPVVGLVSTMSNQKIDWDVLFYAATTRPQYQFVFAGPCTDQPPCRIKELKNVYFPGPIGFQDVPYLLDFFDVCLVPFKKNIFGDYSFPTKVLEYLLMGKLVVSTALLSLIQYENIIKIAQTKEMFVERIDECFKKENKNSIGQGKILAENCSKNKRALRINEKLMHCLNNFPDRKSFTK